MREEGGGEGEGRGGEEGRRGRRGMGRGECEGAEVGGREGGGEWKERDCAVNLSDSNKWSVVTATIDIAGSTHTRSPLQQTSTPVTHFQRQ